MSWGDLFQVIVGVFGGTGLTLLLTLPQQRRRIAAGASKTETDAAATMSTIQLTWVTEARDEARAARTDAAEVRGQMTAAREQHDAEARELRAERDQLRDRVVDLERHVDRLTRLIQAAGIDLPADLDPRRGGTLPPAPDEV